MGYLPSEYANNKMAKLMLTDCYFQKFGNVFMSPAQISNFDILGKYGVYEVGDIINDDNEAGVEN